jgi:hypothetical protein
MMPVLPEAPCRAFAKSRFVDLIRLDLGCGESPPLREAAARGVTIDGSEPQADAADIDAPSGDGEVVRDAASH